MQVRTFLRESDLCRIVVARIHFGGFGHSTVCLAQEKWLKISSCNRTSWRPEGCFAQVFQSDPQTNRTLKHIETWFISDSYRFLWMIWGNYFSASFWLVANATRSLMGIQAFRSDVPTSFWMPSTCFQGYAFKGSLWLFLTWISANAITQLDD